MKINLWLQSLRRSFQTSRRRTTGPQRQADIEILEDRALLATFTVSNLNDSGAGSLRQAIVDANAAVGADDINFTGAGASGTIVLASTLSITDSVSVSGPGADRLSVSGNNGAFRVFDVNDGSSAKSDVEIAGVSIVNGGNGIAGIAGAGLENAENLTLRNVFVSQNDAGPSIAGGVSQLDGELNIINSTLANNDAGDGGAM